MISVYVYEQELSKVQRKLDKLVRKAGQYGTKLSYIVSPTTEKVKVLVHEGGITDCFWTDGVKITLDYDIVKANGWSPIAKIESIPDTERRVVSMIDTSIQPKEAWFYSDMHCDHCNTARRRNTVIICRHEDGREVQVGRSCLKEYTGIDPLGIITQAEIKDIFVGDEYGYGSFHPSKIYWLTETIIAAACDVINKNGCYVKSDMPNSTKEKVLDFMHRGDDISDEAKVKASLIRDWLITKDVREGSLEYNCLAMVESGYANPYHVGYLAYLPVAYDKAMEWERKKKEMTTKSSTSKYVGEVGKRIKIHPISANVVTSWMTQFGMTYIWKIQDDEGNVFTWKTGVGDLRSIPNDIHEKRVFPSIIAGTVKAHTEYRGVCQTELTRCRCTY